MSETLIDGIIHFIFTSKMHEFINSPFHIGALAFPNRLIQGPLAGYTCAPLRQLVYQFTPPAYCCSEMLSAYDLNHQSAENARRFLYRAPEETRLCYQISGHDPHTLALAAKKLETLGADLIDINCGCPKTKIRKKGAGSALLEKPSQLINIIDSVRQAIRIPLTVKLRLQESASDLMLAQRLQEAGVDALIVHGRRWVDDYHVAPNLDAIAHIKQSVSIPVIANGDIHNAESLQRTIQYTGCDAYMISRAGCGAPWLYQRLLNPHLTLEASSAALFMQHLLNLAELENEHVAVLQSKSLVRYYFKHIPEEKLSEFRANSQLREIQTWLDMNRHFTERPRDLAY